jgi:hypothetical protein
MSELAGRTEPSSPRASTARRSGQFPLGTFVEDYEYRPDSGDLDSSNGRFSVTPEYPGGTYAYFLSTDDAGAIAFPYFLTERFRGKLPGVAAPRANAASGVQFAHSALAAVGFRKRPYY